LLRRARATAFWALLLAFPRAALAQEPTEGSAEGAEAEAEAEAEAKDGPQILVIPLGGEISGNLKEAPERLTQVLTEQVRETGAVPVASQVDRADIAAVTGCPAESRECFDLIATTVDVNEVVFGTVLPAESGTGIDVTLTSIRPNELPMQRRFHLEANTPDAAEEEFAPKALAFLLRQEEEPAAAEVDLTVPPPPPPEKKQQQDMSRFSFRRVKPYSWGIAGGGLALLATGTYLLLKAGDKQDEVDNARVDTVTDMERLKDLEEDGKRLTAWGNGCLIAGAAIAVAGAALIAKQASTRPEDSPRPVTVSPVAVRGGAGIAVTMRGHF
jgi:hypothetical protein